LLLVARLQPRQISALEDNGPARRAAVNGGQVQLSPLTHL